MNTIFNGLFRFYKLQLIHRLIKKAIVIGYIFSSLFLRFDLSYSKDALDNQPYINQTYIASEFSHYTDKQLIAAYSKQIKMQPQQLLPRSISLAVQQATIKEVVPGEVVFLLAESMGNTVLPNSIFVELKDATPDKDGIQKVHISVPFTYYTNSQHYTLLPIPYHLEPGVYIIETTYKSLTEYGRLIYPKKSQISIQIVPRVFDEEYVALTKKLAQKKSTPADKQTILEAEEIWQITGTLINSNIFDINQVRLPLDTYKYFTSSFSQRRIYTYPNGTRITGSIHGGVDIAAPVGTPVHSMASGKVVLAKRRIVTGNSVVVSHFPGVYSMYYHLNKIDVKVGDVIEKGEIVGTLGNTGFSTGPHLHWEVRVHNQRVDPMAFLDRLDKMYIIPIRYN